MPATDSRPYRFFAFGRHCGVRLLPWYTSLSEEPDPLFQTSQWCLSESVISSMTSAFMKMSSSEPVSPEHSSAFSKAIPRSSASAEGGRDSFSQLLLRLLLSPGFGQWTVFFLGVIIGNQKIESMTSCKQITEFRRKMTGSNQPKTARKKYIARLCF